MRVVSYFVWIPCQFVLYTMTCTCTGCTVVRYARHCTVPYTYCAVPTYRAGPGRQLRHLLCKVDNTSGAFCHLAMATGRCCVTRGAWVQAKIRSALAHRRTLIIVLRRICLPKLLEEFFQVGHFEPTVALPVAAFRPCLIETNKKKREKEQASKSRTLIDRRAGLSWWIKEA